MLSQTINDRYELLEQIGEGGFGSVYKARDLRLGHLVAVKILSVASEEHEELIRERFVSEAQISAQLQHENILKTYNFGELEGDRLFIVSELLNGRPLSRRLKERPLPLQSCLELMRQLFAGLEEAHEFGVIHRDLKPSNLFLHQRQQRSHRQRKEILKIIDFGIAKSLDSSTKTMTGVVFGSPTYMSPEQIFTPKEVTTKSDIYSAGIIFYQCLAGVVPFKQDPDLPMQIFIKHQSEPPPPIQSIKPSFHEPYLQELVSALLAKVPTQRPSAGQVLDVLEAYLAGDPLELSSAFVDQPSGELKELNEGPSPSPSPSPSPGPSSGPSPSPSSSSSPHHAPELQYDMPSELVEPLESLSEIHEMSEPEEESTTVSPFPFKVSVLATGEMEAQDRSARSIEWFSAPRTKIIAGLSLLALALVWIASSSSSPSHDLTPPPRLLSNAPVTPQETPIALKSSEPNESPSQELPIQFMDPSQQAQGAELPAQAKLDEAARAIAEPATAEREETRREELKKQRVTEQRAKVESSTAKTPTPKRRRKRTRRSSSPPLKKMRLKLPSQIRFRPGESVPFKVYVKNSLGQPVKSSKYRVSASISPRVGRIKGQTLKINATIDATVRAKLKVCARAIGGSRERVCATETLAIYKPMY